MNFDSKQAPKQGRLKKVTEAITIISYLFKLITLVSFDNLWKYVKSSNTLKDSKVKKKNESLKAKEGLQANKL